MKKKYIIELEDNQMAYTTTVIDGMAFIKLLQTLPYTEPDIEQVRKEAYDKGYEDCRDDLDLGEIKNNAFNDGYKCGLDDAWEAARTIVKIDWVDENKIFGKLILLSNIFSDNTAAEAIEKLKQREQKQEEIKVGDEVKSTFGKGVVVKVEKEHVGYIYNDGTWGFNPFREVTKTGRTFPEIAAVLEKMREEQ